VSEEDMLAIQVGNGHFAVRVNELAGVHSCRKIVPLPSPAPGLLGVVGTRGRLVAAYRLASLIGAGSSEERLCWLLVCRGDIQVGLVIEGIDSYLRVPTSLVHPAQSGEVIGEHIDEILEHEGTARSVLSVASILSSIRYRANAVSKTKDL
jgi:chemotaxis signal transduction protein